MQKAWEDANKMSRDVSWYQNSQDKETTLQGHSSLNQCAAQNVPKSKSKSNAIHRAFGNLSLWEVVHLCFLWETIL